MRRQFVGPAEVELAVPEGLRHRTSPEARGHFLEGLPEARRLTGGQDGHREEDPVPLVALDLRRSQDLAHVTLRIEVPRRFGKPPQGRSDTG